MRKIYVESQYQNPYMVMVNGKLPVWYMDERSPEFHDGTWYAKIMEYKRNQISVRDRIEQQQKEEEIEEDDSLMLSLQDQYQYLMPTWMAKE